MNEQCTYPYEQCTWCKAWDKDIVFCLEIWMADAKPIKIQFCQQCYQTTVKTNMAVAMAVKMIQGIVNGKAKVSE